MDSGGGPDFRGSRDVAGARPGTVPSNIRESAGGGFGSSGGGTGKRRGAERRDRRSAGSVKLESKMPAAAAPHAFHLPKVESKTLPNGLRVFVVTDHREPAVAVRLVLTSVGSANDPAGLTGLAVMTANLLTQGTEKRSAPQIANEIDFVGGELSAAADKDATGVTLEITRNKLQTGMDLMSDVVLHPYV